MSFCLSVIIPTYNRAALVRAAVDSALRQSVPPHEVLVCDDGSTDDTLALLRTVFADVPKVKVLSLPHSGLPAAARNAGLGLSECTSRDGRHDSARQTVASLDYSSPVAAKHSTLRGAVSGIALRVMRERARNALHDATAGSNA